MDWSYSKAPKRVLAFRGRVVAPLDVPLARRLEVINTSQKMLACVAILNPKP